MPIFSNLDSFHRGWIIGDFEPSLIRTEAFEICCTHHQKGEVAEPHFHSMSEEINIVTSGRLQVNGKVLTKGEIFVYKAFEVCDVTFLEDTELLVVRIPSAPNDKVLV